MSDGEDMVPVTVRLPESQVDALEAADEAGDIPNRSEGIRAAIGYAIDEGAIEVSDRAQKMATYQRTRRLSRVEFYKFGWQQQVVTVLSSVAATTPSWHPDVVDDGVPAIFDEQVRTLFDDDDERERARAEMREAIDVYRLAWEQDDDGLDDEQQREMFDHFVALLHDDQDDDADDWQHSWERDVDALTDDAVDLLANPAHEGPDAVQQVLSARKDVSPDLAATAVQRALDRHDGDESDEPEEVPADD